jgi:5-methylcytosine-specific restriction endonuclease McrA
LGLPLEQILISRGGSRRNVKLRLLRSGVFENRCDTCGLTDWRGTQLVMHLDHVNGIKDDHRLENLRMLCPNCHSQTDTYGARNKGRWSLQDRPRPV